MRIESRYLTFASLAALGIIAVCSPVQAQPILPPQPTEIPTVPASPTTTVTVSKTMLPSATATEIPPSPTNLPPDTSTPEPTKTPTPRPTPTPTQTKTATITATQVFPKTPQIIRPPTLDTSPKWIDEVPHPNYSWDLNDDGIIYVDHQNQDARMVYVACSRNQNPCLSWPKTEPTGYLTWATMRNGKYVIQYQEGPGTGNHHGVSLDLGNHSGQVPVEIMWSPTGEKMLVKFQDGSSAIYQITGLPGITGDRGKWTGNSNNRIEAVITENIRAIEIPQ